MAPQKRVPSFVYLKLILALSKKSLMIGDLTIKYDSDQKE